MRRRAFCVVADIEPRRFDTMLMRGKLPFTKLDDGWGDYSLDDAFRLRIMLDLVDRGGCEIDTAIFAIKAGLTTNWLEEYPLTPTPPRHDTWLAIASISYQAADVFDFSLDFLAGPYHAIPQLVQGIGENVADITGLLGQADGHGYTPGRIIMANASLAARRVIHSAKSLDIELTDKDFPTFPENAPGALCDLQDAADGWKAYLERTRK